MNLAKASRFAAVGFEFTSPMIVGAVIGHYADLHFHSDPWITLAMFLAGLVAGFYRLIRELQIAQQTLK